MQTWQRETYRVEERDFDRDLHVFWVIKGDTLVGKISPDSIEEQQIIIEDLNNGECVDGWEDGFGGTISI